MDVGGTIGAILSKKGTDVYSIAPGATVFEAIEMMDAKNVGALLVLEGEKVVGIISERDYTRKVALKGKSSRQTPVKEILSSSVITASPAHTIEDCMRLMTENRVRHLPILDSDKVAGIVSIGDLVNWIISAQSVAIDQLENYISGRYPG